MADAVLYEGYLLYPYRATSRKNQLRWQFGVLGPQGADAAGIGEDSHLSMQCLIDLGFLIWARLIWACSTSAATRASRARRAA